MKSFYDFVFTNNYGTVLKVFMIRIRGISALEQRKRDKRYQSM